MVYSQGVGRREAFGCVPNRRVCGHVPLREALCRPQGSRRPSPSVQRLRAPVVERRGGWQCGGRGHARRTSHPAVLECSHIPAFPEAPPPALQKKPSLPVLKLIADWKIQFPCELLGTWGLVMSSESQGHLSQECRHCSRAALWQADDARSVFPLGLGKCWWCHDRQSS